MRPSRSILNLIGACVFSAIIYITHKLNQQIHFIDFHTEIKVHVHPLSPSNTVQFRGAPALNSSVLLNRQLNALESDDEAVEIGNINGIPKIIHQSWKDEDLPTRFFEWSNTCRLKHPTWHWILWTDEANAALVERHFPTLNETYWALGGSIQRADFVRNMYLWAFGGYVTQVYMDLDMECLRPLDSVLSNPETNVSPDYRISPIAEDTHYAYVGSMDVYTDDWTQDHSIPNAFMASTPHHPLWLFPLSDVADRYGATEIGHIEVNGHSIVKAIAALFQEVESVTGPAALKRGVERYRLWRAMATEKPKQPIRTDIFAKALQRYANLATAPHDLVVLRTSIIYPFSWVEDARTGTGDVSVYCLIHSVEFDAGRCHDDLEVFERGARTSTYWSHTWSQIGGASDSTHVGA